jgi:hypothetical protein
LLLPALLCAVLVAMAALQFALPKDSELTSSPGRVIARTLPEREISRAVADPIILRDALFSPMRAGKSNDNVSAPLGGAKAVGIVRGRGFARVVLQDSIGNPISLNLGNRYQGWTLTRINRDSVAFSRGRERLELPIGSAAITAQSYQPNQQVDER